MWCMDIGDVFLWDKNMSSCWRILYGYGICLLVGEEHVWTWEMSSCWIRACIVVEEDFMAMEDVFLWEKNMSCCWRRLYGHGRCLLIGDLLM